ncbi:MAG: hypothetical protein H7839_18455 [Magnetococcus sp. YQC-5]
MQTGIISELTQRTIDFSIQAERRLFQTTKAEVAETLDVKPFVNHMVSQANAQSFKLNISQTAQQKAAMSS